VSGRHTGRTDVPLTDEGRRQAELLRRPLERYRVTRVLTSPLRRAVDTCTLAGLGDGAERTDALLEWDYGEYEGLTTAEIRSERPEWSLWRDGCPGGETAADVARRVDPLVAELRGGEGDIALFAHGHVLRVLAARWLDMKPERGASFMLSTASVSVLGWEREVPAMQLWNASPDF
jgi:broad specificity phosphatase PhoE